MGKTTGFMEFERGLPSRRPVQDRIHDYLEAAGFECTSQWPPPRDWTSEVRAALYKAHGLRAWELALESTRPELLELVRGVTGGIEPVWKANINLWRVELAGHDVGTLAPNPRVPLMRFNSHRGTSEAIHAFVCDELSKAIGFEGRNMFSNEMSWEEPVVEGKTYDGTLRCRDPLGGPPRRGGWGPPGPE